MYSVCTTQLHTQTTDSFPPWNQNKIAKNKQSYAYNHTHTHAHSVSYTWTNQHFAAIHFNKFLSAFVCLTDTFVYYSHFHCHFDKPIRSPSNDCVECYLLQLLPSKRRRHLRNHTLTKRSQIKHPDENKNTKEEIYFLLYYYSYSFVKWYLYSIAHQQTPDFCPII